MIHKWVQHNLIDPVQPRHHHPYYIVPFRMSRPDQTRRPLAKDKDPKQANKDYYDKLAAASASHKEAILKVQDIHPQLFKEVCRICQCDRPVENGISSKHTALKIGEGLIQ